MGQRIRSALATLSSAPWRRAPWLLRRRPGVLATVAGASAVLAASLAAVPLFLSSVGTESVSVQAAERCPRDTGASVATGFSDPGDGSRPDLGSDPFTPLADDLGPSLLWFAQPVALARGDGSGDVPAVLLTRDGALDHVDVIDGRPGPGLWISDRAASSAGLGRGDRATLVRDASLGDPAGGPSAPADAPVAGVYRDLAGPVDDDYWCAHADLLLPRAPDIEQPPPPVLLADRATFVDLVMAFDDAGAAGAWDAPLRGEQTITDADRLVTDLACGSERSSALDWCADVEHHGARITQRPGPLTVIDQNGNPVTFTPPPVQYRDAEDFLSKFFHSHLPFVVDRARGIQTSVGGGVWPVAGFAALAGVGLVAAAASLWFDRRRREVGLLTVRGVSPAALGVKAVLELVVALLAGCAAGVALAYGVAVWLGPSSTLEPAAATRAVVAGVGAWVLTALTVAVVVAARVRTHDARHHRRAWVDKVPWELGLAVATLLSYRRLGEWGVPVTRGADVSRVDVLGLLFPVLFLVTGVAVAMRLLALALPRLRSASRTWPTALYLAVRRVARYGVAVVGLVAASAIAAGVLGYAATLNRSLDATLQAKAKTFIGSDVAVRLGGDQQIPAGLADRATEVAVFPLGWVEEGGRPQDVVVLGIDPDTFERAAFWDASFAGASLGALLDRLAAPPVGGRVPALVVGADVPATTDAGIIAGGTTRLTVEQVATVQAFPGMKGGLPTMFVADSALDELGVRTVVREAWIRGDRAQALEALRANGVVFTEGRSFADVVDRASFLTVSWTFGFMQSLGIAAGVLVLGGVAVYLDARRRGRVLGYAFARRMGLTARQHRRVLLVELTAGVVVGCWLGLALALLGAWLAYERIDPVPGFRPDPLLRPAVAVVVALAAAALVVAVVAAASAQRRADRDDPVEVLRAGV
jgi:putative ABC transport system permease protein